jgi:hypothetical protein
MFSSSSIVLQLYAPPPDEHGSVTAIANFPTVTFSTLNPAAPLIHHAFTLAASDPETTYATTASIFACRDG